MPPRSAGLPFGTLKRRAQFLRVRGGARYSAKGFLLEGRLREAAPDDVDVPQAGGLLVGFTVTKKLGNAVIRNRIRRRLRAAITACRLDLASERIDFVVVARAAAAEQLFAELSRDMAAALDSVVRHAKSKRSPGAGRRP
jgi:ribonuclease P protein component